MHCPLSLQMILTSTRCSGGTIARPGDIVGSAVALEPIDPTASANNAALNISAPGSVHLVSIR